jgi:hypothetical protein
VSGARSIASMNLRRVIVGLAVALSLAACGTKDPAPPPAVHSGHDPLAIAAPTEPLRPGEHFTEVGLPEPYTPQAPGGGTDEYRCFLVDPGLRGDAFLVGSQFLPQNAKIVHHAIFYRIDPADAATARERDTADAGQGWRCFGDAGIGDDAAWVASWAPGSRETLLGEKVGYPMPAGALLVMQVHYNLLDVGNATTSDRSAVRLRLSDDPAGYTPLRSIRLPAPVELPCAAGETGALCDRAAAVDDVARRFGPTARKRVDQLTQLCAGGIVRSGATQSCDRPVGSGGDVLALGGHMHLLGRSIRVELNPGTPGARTLLDIPAYDFDDQSLRVLPAPQRVAPGDTLRVTCTHDAGLRARLPQLAQTPPRYVVWGEGTTDEMCLGLVVLV